MDFRESISAGDTTSAVAPSLYYLRTFHAIATAGGFTAAAARLGLSQPAVSAHIRALERHYRARLFEVRRRRVHLTAEGEALLPYAVRVMALLRDADDAVAEVRRLDRGDLRLAASTTIGNYLLPALLGRFQAAHPALSITLHIGTTAEVIELVAGDRLPLGLIEAPILRPDLEVRPFATDEVVLIAPTAHPWARGGEIEAAALRGQSILRREEGSATQTLVDTLLEQAGAPPDRGLVLGSNEALKRAVLAGLGLAWLPRLAVASELEAGELVVVPVAGVAIHRTLAAVVLRDRRLAPAAAAFLAGLAEPHALAADGATTRA